MYAADRVVQARFHQEETIRWLEVDQVRGLRHMREVNVRVKPRRPPREIKLIRFGEGTYADVGDFSRAWERKGVHDDRSDIFRL